MFNLYNDQDTYKEIPNEELIKIIDNYKETGDLALKDQITKSCLKLIISIANEYRGYHVDLNDLIIEGYMGLEGAIKNYDKSKGAKFISYANYYFKQRMRLYISRTLNDINISCEKVRKMKKVRAMRAKGMSTKDIADELEIKEPLVLKYEKEWILMNMEHFDDDTSETSKDVMMADAVGHNVPHLMDSFENRDLYLKAVEYIDAIEDPRSKEIMSRRFGLHGKPACTLEELAIEMNLSRERIRQIEVMEIHRIKNKLKKVTKHRKAKREDEI